MAPNSNRRRAPVPTVPATPATPPPPPVNKTAEPAQIALTSMGRNISWAMEDDNTLVLVIDVSPATIKNAPLSKSDKPNPVPATTSGFQFIQVNGYDLGINLNMIAKKPR